MNDTRHRGGLEIQEQVFNISSGGRYFYFVSLMDYQNRSMYQNAASLISNIQNLFNPRENESQKQILWEEKINSIIGLLSEFEKYESDNDKIVFEQMLKPFLQENPEKFQPFLNIFNGETIDYEQFMTLLTVLNTDIETAKFLLEDLHSHMKDFNQSFEAALQIKMSENSNSQKDPYVIARQQYGQLTSEAYSHLKGSKYSIIASDMAAISSDLIQLQNSEEDEALQQATDLVINILNGNSSTKKVELQKDSIRLEMLQKIRNLASAYHRDLLSMLQYITEIGQKINSLKQQNQLSERDKEIYHNLQRHLQVCLTHLDLIEQQKNEINTIIHGKSHLSQSNTSSKLIKGFTKDIRQRIKNTLENEKDKEKLEKLETKDFNIQKIEDFSNYINTLKSILQKESDDELFQEIENRIKETDTKIRTRKLTATSETGAALSDATLTSFVQNAFTTRPGSTNIKTDAKTIGYLKIEKSGTGIEKQLMKNLERKGTKMDQILSSQIKVYNEEKTGKKSLKYSTKGDISAEQKLTDELLEGVDKNDIKQMEEASKILSDIFEIDNSIKFFETFNTASYGFEGGSIGDLEGAITNINDMLTVGGITPLDSEFLITAIMNCGAGMLGNSNLNKLEYYLSSIASLCMFNSGGQALQDYTIQFKNNIQQMSHQFSGTKKIHLFHFNTLYVPLAYILRLVKQGIMDCATDIANHANLKGAQVVIYNPVTEENTKISRQFTTSQGTVVTLGDWGATAAAGLPKITLDMTLMAGFLDILENVIKKLQNLL